MTIAELQQHAWQNSEDHGFHETPDVGLPTRLMLIVSELAEALEEHRGHRAVNEIYFDGEKPEGIPIEMADAVIRIADAAGVYGFSLQSAIEMKVAFNATRPTKHGGKAY